MYRLFFFLFIAILACKSSNQKYQISGAVFGTTYQIIYEGNQNHQTSFDSIFQVINHSMSTYIPSSIISRVNNNESVLVDHHFQNVFEASKSVYKATDGFFDPTVGAVVNAWDFGPEGALESVDSLAVDELMKSVGLDNISLRSKKITKYAATKLDFNAIAKGYGVDVVGKYLESQNIYNYLIEIGGEIRASGSKTLEVSPSPWTIGIQNPKLDSTKNYVHTLNLTNQSMATSGSYRKFKVDNMGRKYTHIIDPNNGYPLQSNLLSVSVIADDCMVADAYATALQAMGVKKVQDFLKERQDLKVFIVFENEYKKLESIAFNGFPQF